MNARNLILALTAASLLTPASVTIVKTEGAQHGPEAHQSDPPRGPLPEAVRRATGRFRDVNDAIAAGYQQFGGCVSGPDEGAMGIHFSNFALFDDRIDVDNPEVLVYEPRNGRLHLVAVEYVTPAALWEASHDDFDLPHVMGHLFHYLAGPNRYGPPAIYELHVWAWKDNPHGSFTDWNPRVSCSDWGGSAGQE